MLNSNTRVDMVDRACTLVISCLFGRTDSSRAAFFILQLKKVKYNAKVKVKVKFKIKIGIKVNLM